jgi:RNA polymerase sigma-70 factor (ECF subfamily)
MTDDNDLLNLLRANPAVGFQELLARHGSRLYRAASGVMRDKAEIEDVLQDSLIAVLKNIHTFNGKSQLLTWLYRIVVNNALARLRRASKWQLDDVELDELHGLNQRGVVQSHLEWPSSAEDELLRKEATSIVESGILRLPLHYRSVYVLSEIEGLSASEVAEALDVTAANVKSRLHRARLCLRQMLATYFCERKAKSKSRIQQKETDGHEY